MNDVSFANADSYTTAEDVPLVVAAPGVTGNDTDIDGDTLAASVVTAPIHGTLALSANGSFVYTPAAEYSGPDSFTYKLNDGTADSNVATVTLNVTAVDDAPVAGDNSYSKSEDQTLVVAAPGVLANDTHPDGSPMTAVLVSGVSHGTLSLSPNGGFSYTPRRELHRDRQLHLPGDRRDAELEHRDGDDHHQRGQRRADGGDGQLHAQRGQHADDRGPGSAGERRRRRQPDPDGGRRSRTRCAAR